MNNNETIKDILAEMRDFAEHRDFDSDGNMSTTALRVFADRIEAAWKRDKDALAAPTRNCDRFATAEEAETAFDAMCTKKRTGKCTMWDCPVPSNTGAESCEVAWLFAKAEEGAE